MIVAIASAVSTLLSGCSAGAPPAARGTSAGASEPDAPIIAIPQTALELTPVDVSLERIALPAGGATPDILMFGEPRASVMNALRGAGSDVAYDPRPVRAPSGTAFALRGISKTGGRVVATITAAGVVRGPLAADDAVFREDGALVVRRGKQLVLIEEGGGERPLVTTDLCVTDGCKRFPVLVAAGHDRVAFSMQSRGFVSSAALGSVSLADGRSMMLPGMPGAHLGIAVTPAGSMCTMQIPSSDGKQGAALVCARAPWTTLERYALPVAGAEIGTVGDEVVSGVVGHTFLLDPAKRTLRVVDTRGPLRGVPRALTAADLVVLELDDGYAVIDPARATVGVAKVPDCHTMLDETYARQGAFIVSCQKGQEFEPTLLRIKR